MAKEVLSIRINSTLKVWLERKARELDTNESWLVTQALYDLAKDELPPDYDPSRPERRAR